MIVLEEVGESLKRSKEKAIGRGKKGNLRNLVAESLAQLLPAVAQKIDTKCMQQT